MDKLTVSIVNFNNGKYLIECLKSLNDLNEEVDMDIYVVDNASTDESIIQAKKKFPKVNYLINKKNLGFSKANNLVLRKLKTEFVLILNPDSKVLPGTLKTMLNFMKQNSAVGAASCRVEKADGSLDWASHRGFPTPLASFLYFFLKDDSLYHMRKSDFTKPHEVDSIVGAFFLTRKSVLEKVGLFDEDYFLYGEDLDLCFRIKNKGFKIMYVPEVKIIHIKGISSGIKKHSREISFSDKETKQKSIDYFYQAMQIFYKKNLAEKYPFFINKLVEIGINIKWLIAKQKLAV